MMELGKNKQANSHNNNKKHTIINQSWVFWNWKLVGFILTSLFVNIVIFCFREKYIISVVWLETQEPEKEMAVLDPDNVCLGVQVVENGRQTDPLLNMAVSMQLMTCCKALAPRNLRYSSSIVWCLPSSLPCLSLGKHHLLLYVFTNELTSYMIIMYVHHK